MVQIQSVELTALHRDRSYPIADFDQPSWQSGRRELEQLLDGVTAGSQLVGLWVDNQGVSYEAAVSDDILSHWSGGTNGYAPP